VACTRLLVTCHEEENAAEGHDDHKGAAGGVQLAGRGDQQLPDAAPRLDVEVALLLVLPDPCKPSSVHWYLGA
jgi:hypothetical protein